MPRLPRASRIPSFALAALALAPVALAGCTTNVGTRLSELGEEPAMTKITDPTKAPGYEPVTMPSPNAEQTVHQAGSLWARGARAFFKDQRAKQVGDIVTVTISINDSAKLNNETQDNRNDTNNSGITNLFGLESKLQKILPGHPATSSLINTNTTMATDGKAQINRQEQVTTTLAAIVTQVLPSGNMVIVGKQEVRVNFDVRELQMTGIIRPTDIDQLNTVSYDKIAEARISYGGRGRQSDIQQPHYGTQLLDIFNPF
ncbi:flagellar L-ring protein 1 [Aliidongia dinghuensis]|uniref:Flagellar L-ring protein n=1 Tax=Aliidongia dinghuensis TaxID=1867774 RepID=A0A8J2YZ20_9PROT|nr:flagellar basal body L-ring protein FlgH [Aliidongia dinghuensis]GGF38969.1 flagellar L-ring protein 1 [Aliidongia dinghuensis]